MAIKKHTLDDLYDDDYELVAIHTPLEDYRLAYFLNQRLPILLSRHKKPIELTTGDSQVFFSKFIFDDQDQDVMWTLIQNKNEIVSTQPSGAHDLFLDSGFEIETSVFLIPEFKKVDYFLKIENNQDTFDLEEIVKKINTIDRITTVYEVDPDKIKSKNNLIF